MIVGWHACDDVADWDEMRCLGLGIGILRTFLLIGSWIDLEVIKVCLFVCFILLYARRSHAGLLIQVSLR